MKVISMRLGLGAMLLFLSQSAAASIVVVN